MKFTMRKSILFGFLAATSANAADVVPTQFKAFETDLARAELQLDNPYSFRVGLNFAEGHRFLLHPNATGTEDASSIRRELNFSLMLPYRLETGISLYDSQQATGDEPTLLYGKVEHKSQKLGAALYARYHLIQSEGLRSSILLQYEPGTADRSSFHQASQDKTGLAIAVDGTPMEYLQVGGFLGLTKRKDEKFRMSRLNDEVLYGLRFSAGPDAIKLFGDMQIRSLPWRTRARGETMHTGRSYEIGLSGRYKDIHIQASKLVPTTERYVGVPERGFKIALQYVFGKTRSESKDLEKTATPEPLEKLEGAKNPDEGMKGETEAAPQPAANSIDNFEGMGTDVKDESLGAIPVFNDQIPQSGSETIPTETLAAPGSDEFEKWETTQIAESKRAETPQEKAEREYRNQLAQEKLNAEKVAAEDKESDISEKERLLKELEDEEKKALESADDIEKELNQYTLPTADETGWNGLGNK